ncbi:hypothetical protein Q9L42_017035 [Methylomarinum sp. Ch1-1]|uniref:N-acyl amino acid synthase FeeM catalytic core domain-containing protein n=1 Tax=Methylomarinum roseum TaxID=3067653 RepID=A0AAU7NSV9_9GAMM|nr:hypothetical protein [Methylomarinum sp. Ch1-1]MDP4519964.1 hypothetical protein [Methylomarinum sp. Ch1-1]
MKNKDYTISVLEDYSRLDEIYRLTHDTLAESGSIKRSENGRLRTCPHLDKIPETTILIAEKDNRIIGTITFTLDGPNGVHTDSWFNIETEEVRRKTNGIIGSSWRVATEKDYRNSRILVLDLMKNAFKVGLENNCTVCLFTFLNKHIRIYQRIMAAEVLAKKSVSIDGNIQTELNFMKIDVKNGWNRFKQVHE